jgi:hypothetical protein
MQENPYTIRKRMQNNYNAFKTEHEKVFKVNTADKDIPDDLPLQNPEAYLLMQGIKAVGRRSNQALPDEYFDAALDQATKEGVSIDVQQTISLPEPIPVHVIDLTQFDK